MGYGTSGFSSSRPVNIVLRNPIPTLHYRMNTDSWSTCFLLFTIGFLFLSTCDCSVHQYRSPVNDTHADYAQLFVGDLNSVSLVSPFPRNGELPWQCTCSGKLVRREIANLSYALHQIHDLWSNACLLCIYIPSTCEKHP